MNKTVKFAVATAVALVLGSTAALADDAPAGKAQVTAAAGKHLQAAQKALSARNYSEVLSELESVKSDSKKNEYDTHLMNEFYLSAYAGMKKNAEAEGVLENIINSKFTSPDELKKRVVLAAIMNNQLGNFDKALQFGNRAIKDGYGTPQVQVVVAQSYYEKKDYRNTDKFVRGLVDDQIKAGQAPTEEMLELGLSASDKLNDDAGKTHWLELLVAYHPKPEFWQNLMQSMYRGKLNDTQELQVYRLSADVGALKRGSDYADMAQLSLANGAAGEAVAVLTKAFAANAFTEKADQNRNTHLLDSAKKQVADDQPALPKLEADAASAPTGDKLVTVGNGYFGVGDYAHAIKDLSAGIAKGTTKDVNDARLTLGIAQLRSGSKDAALKTFKTVKGDATLERLAELWSIHARAA